MKLGIVCQNFPPARFEGGISHYSALLAKHLSLLDHEIWAFTSTEFTKPTKSPDTGAGIRVIYVKGPWNHVSVRTIKNIASREGVDAIVLQYSPASFKVSFRVAWALARFPCQKCAAFHTLWGKGLDRLVGLLMLTGTPKIIATNSEIISLIERHFPFFLRRTYWIPIGSNIPRMSEHGHDSPYSYPLISYFGMLYPGKGLETILDVLEELKRRGHKFLFKFIGGGMLEFEEFESEFRKEIEIRGLRDMAKHVGLIPAPEVSKYLSMSKFIFLPYEKGVSDRRGSFMAAIAHGKAVLTSPPIVDMPFLKNGVNVVWPSETSIAGYVEMMEKLLEDDQLIGILEKGAEQLSQQFCWDKIASDYDLVIRERAFQR